MAIISRNSDNIKIEGYTGKWHVIEDAIINGEHLYLLEHSTYGDETEGLIVNSDGELLMDDIWNGFSDYHERMSLDYYDNEDVEVG